MTFNNSISNSSNEPFREVLACINRYYQFDWEQFVEWLLQRNNTIELATPSDLADFVTWLLEGGYATSTVARKISALRSTFHRLLSLGCVATNPAVGIRIQAISKPRGCLASSRIGQLLNEIQAVDAVTVRNAAILSLSGFEQLRTGQLQQLNVPDINLDGGTLKVATRGGSRNVFMTDRSLSYLRRWLAVRQLFCPATRACFISLHWTDGRATPNGRLSLRAIYTVRSFYMKKAS